MTVEFEDGYTLPSGAQPLTHARIMHDGTRLRWRNITPEQTDLADYPSTALDSGDTVDRWRPFENEITSPTDLSNAAYTKTNLTIGSDGNTLVEDGTTAARSVSQTLTISGAEAIFAARVRRVSGGKARLTLSVVDSGATSFAVQYDLRNQTDTPAGGVVDSYVTDLGGGEYWVVMVYNGVSGSATATIALQADSGAYTYPGANQGVLSVLEVVHHDSQAGIEFEAWKAEQTDCMCVAAHNLRGGRIILAEDNDEDATYDNVQIVSVPDNSPLMLIFAPIGSTLWRVRVDRAVLPEIGVLRIGTALQMQQPFYAGATPARMARNTEVLGNLSGSGELLGRSRKRTTLNVSASWAHLTRDWVRSNLDGETGLIQSAEAEPLFIAWRPTDEEDVDYVMEAQTEAPSAMGIKNYWQFSLSGVAHSYE